MEATFGQRLGDAHRAGTWRVAHLWSRECTGLLALAVAERWRSARRRPQRFVLSGEQAGFTDRLLTEMRLATRRLIRTPAFSAAAVVTLGLAIGANTSIFAVVHRVVINPLPYPDSDRLVMLQFSVPRANAPNTNSLPLGIYYHYADRARTLDGIAVYRPAEVTITGGGEPERVRGVFASSSLATVLKTPPTMGRWLLDHESQPGAAPVAVMSHGLWTRRYGGNPNIVGRSITLNGVATSIVGVMPASFAFPFPTTDLWMADRLSRADGFGLFTHSAITRLRDGATISDAQSELTQLLADLPRVYPGDKLAFAITNAIKLTATPVALKEWTIGTIGRSLWMLLASVGLVLLVACANVANLFLVRSDARQREVAVRRALGAGRAAVARYFLTESAVLSAAGCVLGWALASGAVRLLVALGPTTLPRLHEVRLDYMSLAFTVIISVGTGLIFGAIPLLHSTSLPATLHERGRGNTASRRRHHARHLLMAGQVALALVLLSASGLMLRSFQALRSIDPGFEASSAFTFRIGLPDREYPTRSAIVSTHRAILARLAALPGVETVSGSTCLPFGGTCMGNTLVVEGQPNNIEELRPIVGFRAVAPDYVQALGLRLVQGRGINRDDVERGEAVAVVNQALVAAYFTDGDPIGKRVASGSPDRQFWTIVGVVANTPTQTLNEQRRGLELYIPMSIAGGPDIPVRTNLTPNPAVLNYVVRTSTSPLALLPAVRGAVDRVDPNLALTSVETLTAMLDRASTQTAFTMLLLAIAAVVALLLGLIGIYSVMSYVVTQRTNEIGVRLALGESPGHVAGSILRQGGSVALGGIVVGLAAAFAGGRLIESLLNGVSPRDPVVLAVTTLMLFSVALVACWLPARRAARLDPVEALRSE